MVTGESVHYVAGGGSITPRLADDVLYRRAHPEPVKKPSGLDWDAHTPSCSSCSAKSGQIDGTGLCPTCRGDKAVNHIHTEIGSNRHGNFQQLDADEVTKRFTAPTQTPQAAEPAPTHLPAVVEPVATTTAVGAAAPPRPAVRAKVQRVSTHDVLITICSFAEPLDQVRVGALLNDLLHALAQTPAVASSTLAAAGPKSEGARPVGKRAAPSDTPRGPRRDKIALPHHEIAQAYAAGASLRELADRYDVSSPTIARHLDEQNVVRRKQKVDYTPELIEQVRALYVDEALSQDQAAERLGVSLKIVQTAMTRGSIEPRESAIERSKRGIGHPIKIPHAAHLTIVDRYHAGESAPAIALTYDVSAAAIYNVLRSAGVTERHGNRTLAGPGQDHSSHVRDRIAALGVTSGDIKRWALHQGLIDVVRRGIAPSHLVDAYATAHPTHQEAS